MANEVDPLTAGSEPQGGSESGSKSEVSPASDVPGKSVPLTQQVGRVAIIVVAVLFVVFAIFNSQSVDFDWIFGESKVVRIGEKVSGGVPLILLLIGSFVAGALVTWLLLVRRHRRARAVDRLAGSADISESDAKP